MIPRSLSLLVFLVGVGIALPGASADSLLASHAGDLKETEHQVQVRQDGDDLIFTVRRAYRNLGTRVEEADLSIHLPPGAVAIGLRSKLGKTWFPGELMPAEEARRLYEQLTEHGPLGTQGPAMLSFRESSELTLQIFPIAPGAKASVEYELRVPTCYRDGFQVASYPNAEFIQREDREANEHSLRAPRLVLARGLRGVIRSGRARLAGREESARDKCLQDNAWLAQSDDETQQWILIDHQPGSPVHARIGAHVLSNRRIISELSIQLAPKLASMPKRAELVFVVDASYSQGADNLIAQLQLVEDYLSHLPDADFEIVLYRRHAERVFGRWQSAQDAGVLLSRLRRTLPELGNGSNLDEGVALASRLFSKKSDRPQRILALTDSRLRIDLRARVLKKSLSSAPDALMHILDVQLGGNDPYEFSRIDDHDLARVAMATGGMAVNVYGGRSQKSASAGLLGLVRPIQVDELKLEGSDKWTEIPEVGEEGYGHRSMVLLDRVPESLSLNGKIWGKTIAIEARLDHRLSSNLAALVFGRSLRDDLSLTEIQSAALAGKVVSPVTSFVARNLQTGPSSYDDEDGFGQFGTMSGFSTSSSCGCSGCGLTGIGHVGTRVETPGIAEALAELLRDPTERCEASYPGQRSGLSLQVETTGREIVDVVPMGADSPLSQCIVEAAWGLRLGELFAPTLGRHTISL